MASIRGISLNVNGLKSRNKRRAIFALIRDGKYDFALLQETHCTAELEHIWQSEWGGSMFSSHGASNSRGVLTLLQRNTDIQVTKTFNDDQGRLLLLQIQKEGIPYVVGNVYAPTQDHPNEQLHLMDLLEEQVSLLQPQNILIGGDFNVTMDPYLDRSPRRDNTSGVDGAS